MRNTRPRRRGRPPKPSATKNSRYLNARTNNNNNIADPDEEESNQSSSTTNTSCSKYQTRSGRKSSRISIENKTRGRKRKRKEESDDEYYDNEYDEPAILYDDPEPDSNQEDESESEKDDPEMEDEEELEEDDDDTDIRRRLRPVRENAPVFLDDQEVPELILPPSSEDLLISNNDLIRTLSIYEILRHFSQTLRLTPFRFEDFCVVLLIEEQTYLLSEIHIQLLKALIREDELIGTQHGPQDVRDSINIYLHLGDQLTWPEVLRIYLSSDLKKNGKILKDCLESNYPFTSLDKKLTLLEHLCDDFLTTQNARDLVNNEGKIEHDEYCRACQRNGEMLMCDNCPAVFHLNCLDPPLKQVPENEWSCPICKQNELTGVTDCAGEYEKQSPRQHPIGWDRHGRKYWFLSRRIVVEDSKSENQVWYYSSRLQFDQLLNSLDKENYEKELYESLSEMLDEIYRQMSITEKLTKTAKGSRKSYLEVANEESYFKLSAKLKSESSGEENAQELAELEAKLLIDDNDLKSGMQTRMKTGTLPQRSMDSFKSRSSVYNSLPAFREDESIIVWSDDNRSLIRTLRKMLPLNYFQTELFKLGLEGNYRNYENIYSTNPNALSRNQIMDDRDKKRHLSHKFSLTPISELKWGSYTQINTSLPVYSPNGNKTALINILRQALLYLETCLHQSFMHPNWKKHRENWIKAVSMCSDPKEFSLALYILESSMKGVLFNPAWNDSLGFTILQRTTQAERDEQKKKEKKGRDVASDIITFDPDGPPSRYWAAGNGVKLVFGKLRHQIWKQKGEEYRLSGVGGWFWLNHTRNPFNLNKSSVEKDLSEDEGNSNDAEPNDGGDDDSIIDISSAIRTNDSYLRKKYYPKIYSESKLNKFLSLRNDMINLEKKLKKDQTKEINNGRKSVCYSPSCDSTTHCYSPLCLYESKKEEESKSAAQDLTEPVELQKIVRIDGVEQFAKKVVSSFLCRGQLPPSNRFSNGKFKTILVPLTYELRKLSRRSGLCELEGFNYNAKVNNTVWPYGLTPRPFFRTTWLFRTHILNNLHCVALQLRVLWASIRWDDLATKPPASGTNTITTENEVQTIEILKRRDLPPFGLRSEYLTRKIVVPIDLPIRQREVSTPNRSGLRERRRAESPQCTGPKVTERWVAEEEIELWEIKQYNEKQVSLNRQRMLQEQKQLEMKRRLEEMRSKDPKLNSSNFSFKNSTTPTRNGPLFPSRANKILMTGSPNVQTSSLNLTSPFPTTIHTSNGQAIRLQTVNTTVKPTQQFLVRTGNQLITTSNANQAAVLNNNFMTTPNRSMATTLIVRSTGGLVTTNRPIIIPSPINGANIRSISPNIRQSIPFITTTGPKKISTVTTVNAILTSSAIKTVTSSSMVTSVATTSTSQQTPIISTVNLTTAINPSKNNFQCVLKTIDGRTHLIPVSPLTLNANNQIRIIKQVDGSAGGDGQNKTILVGNNSLVSNVSSLGAFVLSNNQKIILQSPSQLKTNVLPNPVVSTPVVSPKPATPITSKTEVKQNEVPVNSPLPENATTSAASVTVPEKKEENNFVLTSEITQEIVRKALLNANNSPEMVQRLMALQRHHKEQSDMTSSSASCSMSPPPPPSSNRPSTSRSNPLATRTSSRSSSSRYSRNRYDDDDYIYEYPQHESRRSRNRNEEDDITRTCRIILKQLIDKVEKDERRCKNRELMEERRQKKAAQQKLKYRQNQIEVVREDVVYRKVSFNQKIKNEIEKEIEKKLFEIKKQKVLEMEAKNSVPNIPINSVRSKVTKRKLEDSNSSFVESDQESEKITDQLESAVPESPAKRARLVNSKQVNDKTLTDSNQKMKNHRGSKLSPRKKGRYCICNRPNDQSMMIGCDECKNWFHIACVKVNPNEVETIDTYYCPDCVKNKSTESIKSEDNQTPKRSSRKSRLNSHSGGKKSNVNINNDSANHNHNDENHDEDENAEYCICKEKYDTDQFYICCDKCNEWLHGRCVGITSYRAEKIAEYICPKCEGPDSIAHNNIKILQPDDYSRMTKVFKSIQSHRSAWPFLEPVNAKEVPDYYTIIKDPMDLRKIDNRIRSNQYRRITEFIYDMNKIFDNCRIYNDPTSAYFQISNSLEDFFKIKMDSYFGNRT